MPPPVTHADVGTDAGSIDTSLDSSDALGSRHAPGSSHTSSAEWRRVATVRTYVIAGAR